MVQRLLLVTVCAGVPAFSSCKQPHAAANHSPLDASEVDPEFRRDWEKVLAAQRRDPAGESVIDAADGLLARDPPAQLQVGALHAKAQQAFLAADDTRALSWLAQASVIIESADEAVPDALEHEVTRLRVFALVRGGDPAEAGAVVEQVSPLGILDERELAGARAIAFDRNGDHEEATLAYAQWRALSADDAPEAGYAERRLFVLAGALAPARLEALAARARSDSAAACLRARAGLAIGSGQPAWVSACRELPRRVGVLLPRSGPLAALADTQLAAATAAVRVLAARRPARVLWRDAGSDPQTARDGAAALLRDGAQIIVGPVGAANVAAAGEAARAIPVVVPGESHGPVSGVAPSLETRVAALSQRLIDGGAKRAVLFAPANTYGDRARLACEKALEERHFKSLKIQRYVPGTTSFRQVVSPVEGDLTKPGTGVIIVDAIARTEMLVRQLRRSGVGVTSPASLVVGTGEGVDAAALGAGHEALEGVVLAPVATTAGVDPAFLTEYRRLEGEDPSPQALLVWTALERAWSGEAAAPPDGARLVRVQGGRLVPLTQEAG